MISIFEKLDNMTISAHEMNDIITETLDKLKRKLK